MLTSSHTRLQRAAARAGLRRQLRRLVRTGGPALAPLPPEPVLEVVVPCFNHAAHLGEALASILAQTHPGPFAVALADDRSTDATPELIAAFAASLDDPRIALRTLVNERNLRQWASLNRAIASSDADLVMILNDDDLLLGDAIEKALTLFAAHPDVGILGAHSLWLEDGGAPPAHTPRALQPADVRRHEPGEAARYRELEDLRMTHSSCTFRRDAWEAAGGYRPPGERLHPAANEDRDLQMRITALYGALTLPAYPLAVWRTDSSHGQSF